MTLKEVLKRMRSVMLHDYSAEFGESPQAARDYAERYIARAEAEIASDGYAAIVARGIVADTAAMCAEMPPKTPWFPDRVRSGRERLGE